MSSIEDKHKSLLNNGCFKDQGSKIERHTSSNCQCQDNHSQRLSENLHNKVAYTSKEIVYSIDLNKIAVKKFENLSQTTFLSTIVSATNKMTSTPTPEFQNLLDSQSSQLKFHHIGGNSNFKERSALKKKKFVDLIEFT